MDPYKLEFSEYNDDVIETLIEVYGDEYASLIQRRYNLIYFVPYVNYEGINSYYRFLLSCKSKDYALKMLKIIGIDVDKYQVTNYADDFGDELKDLCEKVIGGSYTFEPLFRDTPYGFKSFISKYQDGYSDDFILEHKLLFINAVKNSDIEIVTEDSLEEFSKTDEYKRIESLAIYYSGIFDAFIEVMKDYEELIKEYREYYNKELERKREILKNKRIKLFHILEDGLKGRIKKYIDSLDSEEDKAKTLLSSELEYMSDIEYFSSEYERKLEDPNVEEYTKDRIRRSRLRFFKAMGVDISPWADDYDEVIKREDVQSLIVYSVFADEVTRLRKLYLEEARKEFLINSVAYKDAVKYFADNENNRNAIFSIMNRLQVCVNGGSNDKQDFIPIVYYTVRHWQCGCMDYVLLHEIVHAIECVPRKNKEHGCGFEPNIDDPEYSIKEHHEQKRKYERLNEVITDILAIEATEVLHKKDIYLLDDKLRTLTNLDGFNTNKILKDMLRTFYKKYRKLIIKARLSGDLTELTDYIGDDNFEELNDIIDSVDVLVEKGLADKLKENKEDDELVIEYNKLCERLRIVYRLMDETFEERNNPYYGGHISLKKYRKWKQ